MTDITARIISGLLFLIFSPLCLWWLRREYKQRGKLTWLGSILHVVMYGFHGMFCGMLAWGAESTVPPMGALAWLGLPLMVIGAGITIYAMDLFQKFSRWVGSDTPGLQTNKLYRYSRNPQFVGYGLFIFGFFYCLVEFPCLGRLVGVCRVCLCCDPRRGGTLDLHLWRVVP